MSLDFNASQTTLVIPERKKGHGALWALIVLGVAVGAGVFAWRAGVTPSRLWAASQAPLETLVVDEGELDLCVTENGSLESSNNATARCEVEAVMGQVGGTGAPGAPGQAGGRGQQGGQGQPAGVGGAGAGGQPGQPGQPGAGGQGQPAQQKAAMPKSRPGARKMTAAQAKKAASPTANSPSSAAGNPAAAGGQAAAGGGGGGGAGGGGGGGGAGGGAGAGAAGGAGAGAVAGTAITKPVIRSFSMNVAPHMPLRPKAVVQAAPKQQAVDPANMSGGRGGRGGSRGGQTQQQEKTGSTRIISILPEGTRVSKGDVVCELDASAFRDEVKAQKIRYLQAEAWVKQAQSILEVNEIALREYRDGIHPQDAQLIRQYLKACEIEYEKAKRTAEWSRGMQAKGFRASAQVKADILAFQQWELTIGEARGMLDRLEKYTAPRLTKALMAKNEAIRADVLTQKAAFELERERLAKLEKMVAKCTITAPRDGIVVYHNQSNRWGSTEAQIQEGATVREGQPIFDLPDPKHMQVRAKINETKVNQIHSGQEVLVRLDAFPERPLRGQVAEVMPISVQGNGVAQDVRVYFAVVRIEQGFDDLRPGLSAEVDFHVGTLPKVTRVPVQAVREVAGRAFVAVPVPRKPDDASDAPRWRWAAVKLGPSNEAYAQVLDGLKPGDKVLAHPEDLPSPQPGKATAVAQTP
jgi:multidrug resistance efflux pump